MKVTASAAKLLAFLVVTAMTAAFLTLVLAESRGGAEPRSYRAVFTDVSFLKKGSDVRIAGVAIGKVDEVAFQEDGTVAVDFHADGRQVLPRSVRAAIRYKNLLGDRYLELARGEGPGEPLAAGATIPAARTSPALDLDTLVGGFKPLFKALSPEDWNKLSGNLLAVLQGQSGSVRSLLASVASLTGTLADRDQVIGDLIDNLTTVLGTLDKRSDEVSELIVTMQRLVSGLAAERDPITTAVGHVNELASHTAKLLDRSRPDLRGTVRKLDAVAGVLNKRSADVNAALGGLGDAYDAIAGIGLFGDFFNFFVCDLRVKATGPNGQPVYTPWIESQRPRCSGRPTGK